jgi:hypothetical protein
MKYIRLIFLLLLPAAGCVTQYIPDLEENEELLVVEGMITDQPGENTINIYKTLPIWTRDFRTKLKGCVAWITDDIGNIDSLIEKETGVYVTDPLTFIGEVGRKYTLHFTALMNDELHHYESIPMEMIPVPPIDSIYYEKRNYVINNQETEGCQLYLDTRDITGACKFYRWEYSETWEFRMPFKDVVNRVCWVTENSSDILLKNASILEGNTVGRFPLKLISNPVDRLLIKYSILATQYSLNQDEYDYWARLQNSVKQVGGLYDITPSTITGNVYCEEDVTEKVLGYFSVSAVKSRRAFIKDEFRGVNGLYNLCPSQDTTIVWGNRFVEGVGSMLWLMFDYSDSIPSQRIFTNNRYCGDCTVRGTGIKPDFWDDDK